MTRRNFIGLVGSAAIIWPLTARAQQGERPGRMNHVAVLVQGAEQTMGSRLEALRAGLRELGHIEGQNIRLTVRWNAGELDRLSDLAAELLRGQPDVLVGAPVLAAVAAHKHTRTVPIVIANGSGPLQAGIAESYARPGGNVTGVVNLGEELTSKQLQLLKTIAPGTSRVGVLTTGTAIIYEETLRDATRAASALNLKLVEVRISSLGDLPRLAALCGKGNCNGLLVTSDPLLQNWRVQIVSAASQQNLPAVYSQPEYVRDGGLISYAANIGERFHRAATYVDKILKGAKPNELPIEQPTKFELIVNAKTAKAQGIEIPGLIFAQADEVIE
jgi:putative tryptophan/tyrosine transport system substrate-binding protein